MSSIAELRAFLGQYKLPKMTSKKSVLMDAAIERGWRPSGSKKAIVEEGDDDSVQSAKSAPVKKSAKKIETRVEPRKPSKLSEKPLYKEKTPVPTKKAPPPKMKSKRIVEDDE